MNEPSLEWLMWSTRFATAFGCFAAVLADKGVMPPLCWLAVVACVAWGEWAQLSYEEAHRAYWDWRLQQASEDGFRCGYEEAGEKQKNQ